MEEQLTDVSQLAKLHKRISPRLSRKRTREMLLWYADLDLSVSRRMVHYRCPDCGKGLTMPQDEFLERDSSSDLRCGYCRGELSERNGGL